MVWYYWNVHKDTVYIRTYFLFIQFFNIMHCEVACSWNKHNPEQTEQVFPKQPCDLPLKRCFEASVDCKSGYQGRRMCKYFAVVYQVLVVALKVHAKMSWKVPGDLCSTVRHLALDWHRWCRSTRYRKRDALNSRSVAWRAWPRWSKTWKQDYEKGVRGVLMPAPGLCWRQPWFSQWLVPPLKMLHRLRLSKRFSFAKTQSQWCIWCYLCFICFLHAFLERKRHCVRPLTLSCC